MNYYQMTLLYYNKISLYKYLYYIYIMTDTNQQIDNELESLKKSFNDLKTAKEKLDAAKEKLETENKQLGKI